MIQAIDTDVPDDAIKFAHTMQSEEEDLPIRRSNRTRHKNQKYLDENWVT